MTPTGPAKRHNLFQVPDTISFRDASCAIILVDDGRYLMQLRDDRPGIFYPGHWGLFGGALEPGEGAEEALRRELREELSFEADEVSYFTRVDFGFDSIGAERAMRGFFEVRMRSDQIPHLVLGEGHAVEAIEVEDLLLCRRVVPYDALAIWMHHCWINNAWGPPKRQREQEDGR
ncbi:NUDIX domain-containing protein [Aurantimonas sp. MSK8Z-1]|uniref:NUDIX domain-containing protein n=1 Tax=Mangrovibrevibacter kandeliae TaxID=2968473 RepID=UPI002118ABE3|nr:NUDIX domain-containing protein [Aurantimonas sp. MSK8Z-1]MCW4117010.1 NUDIX domain-containing protein [Aurantimonas sp. MSK8Z-1]